MWKLCALFVIVYLHFGLLAISVRVFFISLAAVLLWFYTYDKPLALELGDTSCCGGVCKWFAFGVLVLMFLLYNYHASFATRGFWGLRYLANPSGQSSCTSNPNARLTYNPLGFLSYTDPASVNAPQALCPYLDFHWADSTGLTVFPGISYDGSPPIYASQNPADYTGNPARGIRGGWSLAALAANTGLCAGVLPRINPAGQYGVGQRICTTCSRELAGVIPDSACPAVDNDAICFVCPGYFPGESLAPFALQFAACWFMAWSILVLVVNVYYSLSATRVRVDS